MAEAQTVIGYSFEHSYTYRHKRIPEIITIVPLVDKLLWEKQWGSRFWVDCALIGPPLLQTKFF